MRCVEGQFCLWKDVYIHVKPIHLSVSQNSIAMDQVLVSQYVSGTVDTITGKCLFSYELFHRALPPNIKLGKIHFRRFGIGIEIMA